MSTRPTGSSPSPGPLASSPESPPDRNAGPVARASLALGQADVEVAALVDRQSDGFDLAVADLSLHSDPQQTTLEAKLFAVEAHSRNNRWQGSLENFTAKFNGGTSNPDGSTGYNAGASATIVGVEGSLNAGGWTFTLGAGVGVGGELSVGTRDQNGDGKREICGRASIGPFTVGLCAQNPF